MKVLCSAVVLMIAGACDSARGQDNCLFDKAGVKPPSISREAVVHEEWNAERLEYRAMLKDGEIVRVRYYACEELSMEASLLNFNHQESDVFRAKLSWLAREVLTDKERTAFEKTMAEVGALKLGEPVDISLEHYPEFVMHVGGDYWVKVFSFSYTRY